MHKVYMVYTVSETETGLMLLTSDQKGERLGDIQVQMEKAKRILNDVNSDYDIIRADRYDRGMRELCMSDDNLQDAWMALGDAIMYIKHEIDALECADD